MTFLQFCETHGLIIKNLIANSRWQRVPTIDHPHKSNGAYIWDGERGACQNWALSDTATPFCEKNATGRDYAQARARNKQVDEEKSLLQAKAAKKAGWILSNCELLPHAYLVKKGFEEESGNVHDGKLVIPMRVGGNLVGVQTIDEHGEKFFLYGQRCKGAGHIIGNSGVNVLAEGFATALSAHKALRLANIPCKVVVCFSAGNMIEIAKTLKRGLVISDNDRSMTGQRAAESIGWPYWMSDEVGEDLNDYHLRRGLFAASQELKKVLYVRV